MSNSIINSIGYLRVILFLTYLIDPFNYGYLFGALLIISIITDKLLVQKLDINFTLLLLFSICYAIFYIFNLELGSQFILIYALFPAGFYLIGKTFNNKSLNNTQLFYLLFASGFIFSLPAMVSVLTSIIDKGFVVIERDVPMIWGGNVIPATNMAAYFVLNMSIPAFLVAGFKKFNLPLKLLMISTFIISVLCVLRLGSRTQLSIFFITFIISLIFLIRRQTVKQNVTLFGILFLIFNVFLSYVSFDKDSDIMSAFAGRMESKKYGAATAGGRTERWTKSIVNLWEKPLGWDVTDFGFSHNLWFDIARVGGTLSFILLLIFTIKNALNIKRAILLIPQNALLNTAFICYGLSFYLLFFVEPIFDGYFPLFVFYCFFLGIIAQYNINNRAIKNEQNS
ncbi:hypothetical protein [Maribacter sp. 1_MG-2023]|uniref:hypothetical protein n=1 Tax=Maribacter sp. 1_MG-2023 TaxID=3062677 RepID=UPI0026E45C80|nr:hypothetical protein [Maribacter sp. 1_MG-2023]MDO6472182.1 hypothetical protein [Maribacter sp. 1_MG-2023]